ncbi:MAG TPA: ribose-phosphate diphosphokinase [bacterium]|nr:ribose-phosphate diphosphokinase [bacterium]HPN43303.1 ribose-phosphate diphosphokinase [bacterium]
MYGSLKVFHGNSHPQLAAEICTNLQIQRGKIKIHRFSNENIKVKIEENVRNDDVFVIQTASNPLNEHFMELLIILDALKYASAKRITAVMPYYFYARSDKKDEPRISITARLVAELLLTAGADRILTMQLHSPQIMGFSRIPMDQLLPTQIMVDHYRKKDLSNAVIAATDVGGAKAVRKFARLLDLPMVILDKERIGDKEKVVINNIIGNAEGKDVLILDDEILSGGSILQAAEFLHHHGARRLWACCTHGFFTNNVLECIEMSFIEELVTTDSIPQTNGNKYNKLKILSVAELFANAIKAIHVGDSVGALFRDTEQE